MALFTSSGYGRKRVGGGEEIEASEQGWWYTNYPVIFSPADSMYPVHQLGGDNRSILHMSVFL